jgi:hypothetical protein
VALNGSTPYTAFLDSLHDQGYNLVKETLDADAAIIWSVLWHGRMLPNKKIWDHYRKQNKPVIVLEVGSIKRGITWRVGINGINRTAFFGNSGNNNTRANQLGLVLKPWRLNGEYILICGQHDKSLQWQGMPTMSRWITDTIDTLQIHYDYPIVVRPHPRCNLPDLERQYKNVYRQDPQRIEGTYDDFNINFSNVRYTVSWSSNPGIHSIIGGVPAFVSPYSLAFDVACPHLLMVNNPNMPDRQQWINDLAWTEYTVEEISNGLPISRLRQTLDANIINAMI